jgi:proteasome lid subunit RPN8/RPN11
MQQMIAHGQSGKPEEICGIVRGVGGAGEELRALEVIPARNVADERIQNYTVDPRTLLRQFEFEDAGERMLAIYHSHPVSAPYPSATDAWNANYPETIYIILGLADDTGPQVRAWALETEEIDLAWETLREALPFFEARTGLFGYHQGTDEALPAVLAETVAPPFYVVYAVDGGELVGLRLVSVREHPVLVMDA